MASKKIEYNYDYNADPYKSSEKVNKLGQDLENHNTSKPGAYSSTYSTQYKDVMDKILNREKFSYDVNGDALYNSYKNQYMKQGKAAMQDTIGQASALTGGYGNSYAQTAGQSVYNQYLGQLNDKIPELYQLALDKYNQDTSDLYNKFSMLQSADDTEYNRYRDTVNDWQTDRNYLTDLYNTESDRDYNRYADNRDFDYGLYADKQNFLYNQDVDNRNYDYQQERDLVEDQQWREKMDYQAARDAVADQQWREEMDYQAARDAIADQQWQDTFDYNASLKNKSSSSYPENTLSSRQREQLDDYAQNESAFVNYLSSLIAKGVIDEATAAYYYEEYFPEEKTTTGKPVSPYDNSRGAYSYWNNIRKKP